MSAITLIIGIGSIAFALVIHEFAHAWMAYQLGDPTAKYEGRLTFNPVVHFEPIGAICLICSYLSSGGAMIVGWAKPVPINADQFKNRNLDTALVAMAGPMINMICAFLCSMPILLGLVNQGDVVHLLLAKLILANVCFAVFNMIPWPPLDGWKILGAFAGKSFARKMENLEIKLGIWALVVLLVVVYFFGQYFLYPPINFFLSIFMGRAA